jgi:N-acetylneuraminate synthase
VLSAANLRAIRPGYGLPPKHLDELIGLPVARAVKRGTPMGWELVRTVLA